MIDEADIVVIGAGAAGLMAAIWAARQASAAGRVPPVAGTHGGSSRPARIVALDGARTIGAKILVAGGGRCNVTHDVVEGSAFAGSTSHAIQKVLRRFDVSQTVEFFRELGVHLKREETGKLFPVTDDARTVLDALLSAVERAGAELRHPWRVQEVAHTQAGPFVLSIHQDRELRAARVIIATGGKSLPKTGSDGHGYNLVKALGHTVTPRVFPGLVPLRLPANHFLCTLSGLSANGAAEVRSSNGKRLASFTGPILCTHFGLSGPCILDISRYHTDALLDDAAVRLLINWLPGESFESVDSALAGLGKISPGRWLRQKALPQRLAETLCLQAGVDPSAAAHRLTREQRRGLAHMVASMAVPVIGDRGFGHAEVTAGGVPLRELRLETMESRRCPGLYLCGEICDVDGRIGGYNFQWAWASGYVAGMAAGGSMSGTGAHRAASVEP